ncbi:thiamine ABC transporter substrate binding subunit [Curvivirga aplysinae]|uniref:thiamine ABC transporter substrate binding subunit n=1 Tax=Curvivirga aplysinae TaxID=2529852 RepID=UPI0012BC71F0|nr:thiamine ABC transporter substrate binding subunit [Curvivirga aplysinae]MTI11284.1 thiamine ABC transporter substrate binding subunit [Curvivirga aplysinae]
MSLSQTFKKSLAVAVLALAPALANANDNVLTVYTYDSFTSDWGPGPQVEKAFEAECGCDLQWVATEDAVGLLSRLRLEGSNSKADIVLGLDQNLISRAKNTELFIESATDLSKLSLPNGWSDTTFVPFDYGHFAFVYDSSKTTPPTSLKSLVEDADVSIVIQDPRTSSPGLGLLLWVKSVYGDQAGEAWEKLSKKIVTTTKGWSEAYGMFLEGEADMVLSYTTSPAYHMEAEGEFKYKSAPFSEGHYEQIEVAAKLKNAPNPALADQFLNFMVSDKFQSIIPTTNWMLPVAAAGELPAAFAKDKIHYPETSLSISSEDVAKNNSDWVDEWLEAVSQ